MKKSTKITLISMAVATAAGVAEYGIQCWLDDRRICKELKCTKEELKFMRKAMKDGIIVPDDPSPEDLVIRVAPYSEEEEYFNKNAAFGDKEHPITIRLGEIWGLPYNEYVFYDEERYGKARAIMDKYWTEHPEEL